MTEFEVGDKVRLVNKINDYIGAELTCPDYHNLSLNDTFTIIDIGNNMDANFLEFEEIDAWFHKDHFEKVEQEFEVGDRICVVNHEEGGYEEYVGLKGTVCRVHYENKYPIKVDLDKDNEGQILFYESEVELISKGEDNMKNLEGIEVTGDCDLLKTLHSLAMENGFNDKTPSSEIEKMQIFSDDSNSKHHDKEIFTNPVYKNDFTRMDGNKAEYNLPEDWDKAKKFVTQFNEPDIEVAGREVIFNEDSIEIGCQTISNNTLKTVQEFREEMADESLHVGTVEFKGHDVTETQLNDIIGYQLDGYEINDLPF